MKSTKKRTALPRAAAQASILAGAALVVLWLTSLAGVGGWPTRIWRGYYTLIVSKDFPRASALDAVVERLGPGVVSGKTATVSYWSFTGVERVTIDGVDARIDRSDPRRDRVMDALAGYFHEGRASGAEWRILYLPARRAAAGEYLRIASVLGFPLHGYWRLEDFDPFELLFSMAVLLAMAAILASPSRKGWGERLALTAAGILPWIPFVLAGGVARTALSLLLFAAWHGGLERVVEVHGWDKKLVRDARGSLVRMLTAAAAGLIVLIPGSGFSAAAALSYVGSVSAAALLVLALALFWGKARRPRQRRKAFQPVPILKTSKPSAAASGPGPTGLLLPFAAVAIVAGIGFFRSIPLPSPLPVPGVGDFSWASLHRLSGDSRAQRLPDISDLAAHEAFQETIAFGRPWGLPREDEKVYIREYAPNARTGALAQVMRRVKVFDAAWLAASLDHPPNGSIEQLLIRQGRPTAVAIRGQARSVLREIPVALLALFLFSTWFARNPRTAPLMRSVLPRFNGAARRNQAP